MGDLYPFHINFYLPIPQQLEAASFNSILLQNYGIKKDKHKQFIKHITQTLLTINCVHLATHTGDWQLEHHHHYHHPCCQLSVNNTEGKGELSISNNNWHSIVSSIHFLPDYHSFFLRSFPFFSKILHSMSFKLTEYYSRLRDCIHNQVRVLQTNFKLVCLD